MLQSRHSSAGRSHPLHQQAHSLWSRWLELASLQMQLHGSSPSAQEMESRSRAAMQKVLITRGDDQGAGHERLFYSSLLSDKLS